MKETKAGRPFLYDKRLIKASFALPEQKLTKLKDLAYSKKTNFSSLVRQILKEYLEKNT